MIKKNLYEAPDAHLIVLRYEEAFLQGSNAGKPGADDDIEDYDEDF